MREGLFRPLGEGSVDVAEFVAVLERAGYDGWYVLEQDVVLDGEPPARAAADVAASLEFLRPGGPAVVPRARRRIGAGVVGLGWMGQAHSRSYRRIPAVPRPRPDPVLVVCAEAVPQRRESAVADFGFGTATDDWRRVVDDPAVDVVVVTAPNMLHVEISSAAAAAGKAVFCEKPVGGTPAQIAAAERAARHVTTGVGYNYRWAPLVQCARELIADGRLGTITNYRGRFLSCYGNDPLGVLSLAVPGRRGRLRRHERPAQPHASTSPTSSSATSPRSSVSARRSSPNGRCRRPAAPTTTAAPPGARRGAVTNEDYAAAIVRFAGGAIGTFESSRTMVGPESQHAFDVHGTLGALSWNLERMNELQVRHRGR